MHCIVQLSVYHAAYIKSAEEAQLILDPDDKRIRSSEIGSFEMGFIVRAQMVGVFPSPHTAHLPRVSRGAVIKVTTFRSVGKASVNERGNGG